jgi:hypothetical protein
MDFNRRRFLTKGGLTLGLGSALAAQEGRAISLPTDATRPLSDYESVFAKSTELAWLGMPRRWELVRQGLHPFSPERVIILPAEHKWNEHIVAFKAERVKKLLATWRHDLAESFWSSDAFGLYTVIAEQLSAYYPGKPQEDWLCAFALGEQFYGSFSQDRLKWLTSLESPFTNTPRVVNPPADWWLVLLQMPLDLATIDDVQPVRLAVGHVHCGWPAPAPFRCKVGAVCTRLYRLLVDRGPDFIDHVASLDRVSAAWLMNQQIAVVLDRLAEERQKESKRYGI